MAEDYRDLESFLDDGYEIKSITIEAGRYVMALQRGRKAALVHVDGVGEDFLTTEKSIEIGY